jgi:hypothetical protein
MRYRERLFLLQPAVLLGVMACQPATPGLLEQGPADGVFVLDPGGLIEAEPEGRMNATLAALLRDADIELVTVAVEDLGGQPITMLTNALFERWQVGRRTRANRGALLVIGREEARVRFELAYDLEPIFTDGFASYIEREQMVPYFENGEIGPGIEATVELVARRAFEAMRGDAYDPLDRRIPGSFRSGGAGADTPVTLAPPGRPAPPPRAGAANQSRFAAQPTPQLAWERFLEANRRRIKDPDLGIYDTRARTFMRAVVTDAGQDHIADLYDGQSVTVRMQGNRAAVVFLDDSDHLLAPWFFHFTGEGWQPDGSMYPDTIGYNHLNQWRFRRQDHAYMFAFDDFRLDANGFATLAR